MDKTKYNRFLTMYAMYGSELKGAVSRNSAEFGITKCPLNPRET